MADDEAVAEAAGLIASKLTGLYKRWTTADEAEVGRFTATAMRQCASELVAAVGDVMRDPWLRDNLARELSTEGIKATYRVQYFDVQYGATRWGGSTAYLSDDLGGGVWSGTNKYTDEPVTVWWSGKHWWQIPMEDDDG